MSGIHASCKTTETSSTKALLTPVQNGYYETDLQAVFFGDTLLIMTDKQAVIDALGRLPENVTLKEIADELKIMASVRSGRNDIAAGRSKTHEETEQLFESWATSWTSK